MVDGLAQVDGHPDLMVVGNTGDDGDLVPGPRHLHLRPFAGVVSERGWGYPDDTFRCLDGLATYGEDAWFGLGDRDLATHLHRTLRLAEGAPLSQVTAEIAARPRGRGDAPPDDRRPGAHAHPPRRGAHLGVPGGAAEIAAIDGVAGAHPRRACSNRDRPLEPDRLDRDHPGVPGVRDALRRARGLRGGQPDHRGRPVEGPAKRFLAGAGSTSARRPDGAHLPRRGGDLRARLARARSRGPDRGAGRAAGADRRPDARPAGAARLAATTLEALG